MFEKMVLCVFLHVCISYCSNNKLKIFHQAHFFSWASTYTQVIIGLLTNIMKWMSQTQKRFVINKKRFIPQTFGGINKDHFCIIY